MMFKARRRLLPLLKDAVWFAHVRQQDDEHELLKEVNERETRDLAAEAYYTAREMAHWAHEATR